MADRSLVPAVNKLYDKSTAVIVTPTNGEQNLPPVSRVGDVRQTLYARSHRVDSVNLSLRLPPQYSTVNQKHDKYTSLSTVPYSTVRGKVKVLWTREKNSDNACTVDCQSLETSTVPHLMYHDSMETRNTQILYCRPSIPQISTAPYHITFPANEKKLGYCSVGRHFLISVLHTIIERFQHNEKNPDPVCRASIPHIT